MKALISLIALTATTFLFADIPDDHYKSCPAALRQIVDKADVIAWRAGATHKLSDNSVVESDFVREENIEKRRSSMISFIFNDHDVPEMYFFPAPGTGYKRLTPVDDVTIPRWEVSGEKVANGFLSGSLLLPVSGHCGLESAKKWKDTDTYSVYVADAQGKTIYLAKDVKSLDYVTIQELKIPLQPNQMVSVFYHRSGSGGPGGYREGRTLELIWKK